MEHHEHQKQEQAHSRSEVGLQEGVNRGEDAARGTRLGLSGIPLRALADEAVNHRLAKNQAEPEE